MYNLAIGRVNQKFDNSISVQKRFFSLYSNLILNLYIVYESNTWLRNPTILLSKTVYLVQSNW